MFGATRGGFAEQHEGMIDKLKRREEEAYCNIDQIKSKLCV